MAPLSRLFPLRSVSWWGKDKAFIKLKEKHPRNEERSMDPITLEDVQHVGGINIRSIIKRQRNRPRNLTIVDIESCACTQKEPVRQSNVKTLA